jgi:uncharacterized membrane protein YkoI
MSVGVAAILILVASCAFAAEKKINRSALPAAVEKTVQEQSQGATINGFSMEKEKGKAIYEVEMTISGHGKDVSISADGSVVEVEEEVAQDSLPELVNSALTKRAGAAKIIKVEAVSKDGKVVSYEATTQKGKKQSEVAVGPNGEKVADED